MELEVRHLRVVLAIAERGSIGAAAVALGLPQSAVSTQLSRIERSLGGPLFVRRRTGTEATALGELVIAQAEPVIGHMNRLNEARQRLVADSSGTLRVGGNESAAYARALPAVMASFDRAVVSRSDWSSRTLMDWLQNGELDLVSLGVHPGFDDQVDDPRIDQLSYVEEEPFFVAISEQHPLANVDDVALEDLKAEPWVLPPGRPDGTMDAFRHAFQQAGFEPMTPHGKADLGNFGALISGGHAVGIATPSFDSTPGTVIVPLRDKVIRGRLVVRWRRDAIDRSVVDVVRPLLAQAFAEQVLDASVKHDWWHRSPHFRPTISSDLVDGVDHRFLDP